MRSTRVTALAAALLLAAPLPLIAEDSMFEDFEAQPETRWQFVADTVMGGVSSGEVAFESEGAVTYAHMTGRVSTENNGGFIQIRTEVSGAVPDEATGLRLIVRGNNQRYFVHLRTNGTVLPWQYYQAGFDVSRSWTEIRLPFAAFEASGGMLRMIPRAQGIRSVGIVAYGRDHDAEIDVREVGFY